MMDSIKVSIGIIAHNEAWNIGRLVADLSHQTLITKATLPVEILVVANGCTDDTAALAESALAPFAAEPECTFRVIREEIPSKTNAWNLFVHHEQADDAVFTIMMDADIRIPQADLLERLIGYLQENEETRVALGHSRKSFDESQRFNLIKYVRMAFGGTVSGGSGAFCGQLYCARTSEIRRIVLPIGILSQDGFLRAMFLTSGLTEPENTERIRMLPDCFHMHPDYSKLSSVFRYEKRQAIGTAIYITIYQLMGAMKISYAHRMAEIRRLNLADPDWVKKLVDAKIKHGERFIPMRYVFRSLKAVQRRRGWRKIVSIPFALVVLPFDILVCWRAEQELRAGNLGTLQSNTGKFKIR